MSGSRAQLQLLQLLLLQLLVLHSEERLPHTDLVNNGGRLIIELRKLKMRLGILLLLKLVVVRQELLLWDVGNRGLQLRGTNMWKADLQQTMHSLQLPKNIGVRMLCNTLRASMRTPLATPLSVAL
jgi:hypothetical protein